jgi:hypothetical protein
VDADPTEIWLCHCRQCRRAQGGPFAASVPVPRAAFRLTRGEASLRAYRSSPGKQRWFCGDCGSPLFSEVDGATQLRLRAGTLDEGVLLKVKGHIFIADKAPWDEVTDTLPQHAGREPGRKP